MWFIETIKLDKNVTINGYLDETINSHKYTTVSGNMNETVLQNKEINIDNNLVEYITGTNREKCMVIIQKFIIQLEQW